MATLIKRSLAQHEEIIESALKSGFEIGESLLEIRDAKLYKPEFDTFEAYCKTRWNVSKSSAYQFMEMVIVRRDLSVITDAEMKKIGGKQLTTAQADAIAKAAPDSKTRAAVMTAAIESAPKDKDGAPKVTAAVIKKAAQSLGVKKAPKKKAAPKPPPNATEKPLPIPEREPGDDPVEQEHRTPEAHDDAKPNKKLDFDDKLIDQAFSKLIKSVDDRARALKQMNSAYHKTCLNRLDGFMTAFKEWKAVRR